MPPNKPDPNKTRVTMRIHSRVLDRAHILARASGRTLGSYVQWLLEREIADKPKLWRALETDDSGGGTNGNPAGS